jgi:hypothetical protein
MASANSQGDTHSIRIRISSSGIGVDQIIAGGGQIRRESIRESILEDRLFEDDGIGVIGAELTIAMDGA